MKKNVKEFDKAYEEYSKKLNIYAFFKINDHAISEDLVQETYIKTWVYLQKGGKIDKMKAFLHHVLNNLIVDQYRKKKNISLDSMLEGGYEPATDNSKRHNDYLDGKKAVALIKKLPANYRDIMRMRHVQELTITEISQKTKESKNTVTVKLHRGMEKLKALYK